MAWDNKGENKDATFKEQMLAKVRNALIERQEALFKDIDKRTETWVPIKEEDGTAITFVQNFKEHGGIFIYLESEAEFAECIRQLAPENGWEPIWCTSPKMKQLLSKYGVPFTDSKEREPKQKLVSLTGCECLVAQTGSIVLSDAMTQRYPIGVCHHRPNRPWYAHGFPNREAEIRQKQAFADYCHYGTEPQHRHRTDPCHWCQWHPPGCSVSR